MTTPAPNDRSTRAEALFAAWASRVEAGEELDFEELVRANATLEPELRALHDDWKHFAPILGNVVPGLIASGDGLVLPSLTRGPDVDEGPPSDELLEKLGLHAPDTKRYRFRGRIGTGGQGVVLKVWDAKLSRPLAMKIVLGRAEDQPTGQTPRVDGRRLTRFVDEARIASQLNHPGIVPVHELGADESGRAFFTMKLVKGDDLSRIFDKAKRGEDGIGLPRAVSYLLRVCEAMAYAHDRGVIHRDLKPANVMVGAYGEVHVMDWGLARVIGDGASAEFSPRARPIEPISQVDSVRRAERSLSPDSPLITEHGHGLGTPCYMSPEQARGDHAAVGPASDIYAVGAMLYQLLTGTPPYLRPGERRSPEFIAIATVEGPPPPVESLAPRAIPELVAICERAMARDPAARYASMRALAADLQAFLEGRVVRAYETGAWAETRKWVKRNRALTVALASTVLASFAGATAAFWLAERADRSAERALANELVANHTAYYAAVIGAQAAAKANEPAKVRKLLDSAPEKLRGWEWYYLYATLDTSLLKLKGDTALWSPDGACIVTTTTDNVVHLWNASSGAELVRGEGHTASIESVTFCPDGERIATASRDNTVRVWSRATGHQILKIEISRSVLSVAYSSDGAYLVTLSSDGKAQVWEAKTGDELASLGLPAAVQVQPGSEYSALVVGTSDIIDSNAARIWLFSDAEASVWSLSSKVALVQSIQLSGLDVRCVAVSPDGSAIATAFGRSPVYSPYFAAHLRSTKTDSERQLVGHSARINSIVFSPDGALLATSSEDGTARIWNSASGELRQVLSAHRGEVLSVAFSSDSARLVTASSDTTARVWDVESGVELVQLDGSVAPIRNAKFGPDDTKIVAESDDGQVFVWSGFSAEMLVSGFEGNCGESAADLSPDGTCLVVASEVIPFLVADALTGEQRAEIDVFSAQVRSVNFCPEGSRIVAGLSDGYWRVLDVLTGRVLTAGGGQIGCVNTAVFSRDGARIVTASEDGTVRVWCASNGIELVRMVGHGSSVRSASLSPDGVNCVTASDDGTVRVWDVLTGQELARLIGTDLSSDLSFTVRNAIFYADGTRVVTVTDGGGWQVLDWRTGRQIKSYWGHTKSVNCVSLNPDASRVATGSSDGTVRVWDASTGRELAVLRRNRRMDSDIVTFVKFSADGSRIIASYCDGSVLAWDSVPCRVRYAQRQALEAARPAGERSLTAALIGSAGFVEVGACLSGDTTLDPLVRRAAFNSLSRRSAAARVASKLLAAKRAERLWVRRMLGGDPWPTEAEVEIALDKSGDSPTAAHTLNERAESIIDPERPNFGEELRAVVFARRAVELEAQPAFIHTLGRALFRVGQFDDALRQQRWALEKADEDSKSEYQGYLDHLQADIAEWRDENGSRRTEKWLARIAELDREIAEIEADPDVQIWLREKR